MPENLYPQLPTAPPMSQESFNIKMVRKYYQDIANFKEKYTEKQWKYNIGEIHYHNENKTNGGKQIEFSAESNQFETKIKSGNK